MATVKSRQDLPDTAKVAADLVERLGFKWELDYEYPLDRLDLARRVQIRTEEHYIPSDMVSRFREAMRRGDKFPPVVVTKDGKLVDGNTRVVAAKRNQYPTIQALVLNEPFDGAGEGTKRRYRGLGAAFNARNGKGIDKHEIGDIVQFIASDPIYDATRIAYLLGIAEHTVQAILAEKKARERAEKLGLHVNGSLTASQLRILGPAKINEAPWRRLFTLVQDSGMQPNELRPLVKSLRECGSEEKAGTILEEEYQAREQQIAEYKATNRAKPPVAAQLRQRLGFVLNPEFGTPEFIEYNRNLAANHLDTVERAVAVLAAVIDAQRERNAEDVGRAA